MKIKEKHKDLKKKVNIAEKERIDIKKFPIDKLDSPNNHFVEDLFFHFK